MITTMRGIPRSHPSLLSACSALTVGLVLAATAGHADAQAAPADPAAPAATDPAATPADQAPAAPPTQQLQENDPLAQKLADMIRKEMGAMPKLIEFHGYFRAGTGINSKGGQ